MEDDLLPIGEVARRAGIAPSALRFYESQRLVRAVRSAGGQRRFPRDVLRRIAFVRVAQRVGLGLDEIRAALAGLPGSRTPTREDWEKLSRSWRPRLDAQIRMLEGLRDRLTSCIGCGCLSFRACALYNPDDAAARLGTGPRYLLGDAPGDAVREPARGRRGARRRPGVYSESSQATGKVGSST
jgi:MerR family redox-sensitive transcriptional activator SoxR